MEIICNKPIIYSDLSLTWSFMYITLNFSWLSVECCLLFALNGNHSTFINLFHFGQFQFIYSNLNRMKKNSRMRYSKRIGIILPLKAIIENIHLKWKSVLSK